MKKMLIIGVLAWLAPTACDFGGSDKSSPARPQEYEPQFRKDGELAFLDTASRDTIKVIDGEFAKTPEEISYGMMYRKTLDLNTGMLFFMGSEAPRSFYMKNTFVALDIIFINKDLEVVSIQRNAQPLSEKSLPSEGPATYVLEVMGGFCDKHGIDNGTVIRYE